MERFFSLLRPAIRLVGHRSTMVLTAAAVLSAVSFFFALHLTIDTNLANLLPPDYESVKALEKLRETVGGESELAIAIESPSFEANVAFAEIMIPEVLAMKGADYDEPYFQRVEFRKDVSFLRENALYFATEEELDMLQDYLDAKIEQASLDTNPFFFDIEEDDESDFESETDSLGRELDLIYRDIVSSEYPISEDSLTLVVRFYPSGSQTDFKFIEAAYRDLDLLLLSLDPTAYHDAMRVTSAGRLLRQLIEATTIRDDVIGSFGTGILAVLLMVVFYFLYKSVRARTGKGVRLTLVLSMLLRAPVLAALIGIPLLMSLSWTFALASIVFGTLNLMTSALGLVLFGLGIDYGIHFYARYTEERGAGRGVTEAIEITFMSTGQAVTVGALTTSAAMFVLILADFRGFSQFGLIAGTGIMNALVAMLFVMPAMIVLFERTGILRLGGPESRHHLRDTAGIDDTGADDDHNTAPLGAGYRRHIPAHKTILLGSTVAVIAAIVLLPRVSFEYQFGKLEPRYEAYYSRAVVINRVEGRSRGRNPAYIVVDSREEVDDLVAAVKYIIASDTTSPTILKVESLQDRFPLTSEKQQNRLDRLREIRAQLADRFMEADSSADIRRLRLAASTTETIQIDQVPEFLRRQFTSKSGEIGNFVMIYPSVGLSDGRNSIAFSNDVGTITTEEGKVYHAGSTSLVAADMLKLMQKESPWMIGATFLIVCALMYLNFRSLRWSALALLPLIVGILWMLFVVELLDLRINFYNLIVFPAILGIGNDAGVHLVHRYREEGSGSMMRVVLSTGEHVIMGSLTTMVGFGGLLLSFHPGLHSIGELAVIGIGTTLLAAIIFLPAMIERMEQREQAAKGWKGSATTNVTPGTATDKA